MLFGEVAGLAGFNVNDADDAVFNDEGNRQFGAHIRHVFYIQTGLGDIVDQEGFALLRRQAGNAFTHLDADALGHLRRVSDSEADAQLLGLFVQQQDGENFVINDAAHLLGGTLQERIEIERGVDHLGDLDQQVFDVQGRGSLGGGIHDSYRVRGPLRSST